MMLKLFLQSSQFLTTKATFFSLNKKKGDVNNYCQDYDQCVTTFSQSLVSFLSLKSALVGSTSLSWTTSPPINPNSSMMRANFLLTFSYLLANTPIDVG